MWKQNTKSKNSTTAVVYGADEGRCVAEAARPSASIMIAVADEGGDPETPLGAALRRLQDRGCSPSPTWSDGGGGFQARVSRHALFAYTPPLVLVASAGCPRGNEEAESEAEVEEGVATAKLELEGLLFPPGLPRMMLVLMLPAKLPPLACTVVVRMSWFSFSHSRSAVAEEEPSPPPPPSVTPPSLVLRSGGTHEEVGVLGGSASRADSSTLLLVMSLGPLPLLAGSSPFSTRAAKPSAPPGLPDRSGKVEVAVAVGVAASAEGSPPLW